MKVFDRYGTFIEPTPASICSTGMEILAAVATVGSMGMTIIGGAQQAEAQRMAGETNYQNALARQSALDNEAKQREAEAKEQQAAAQRRGIEQKRRATITAGRAQAVMAASGAGVDDSIISGILNEGDFAFDSALYEGDSKAQKLNYDAELRRFEGRQGVRGAAYTRDVYNRRADQTMTNTIGKSLFQGASLAAKYGPDLFSSKGYDLGKDSLRTRGDADLGGYGVGTDYTLV